jgi:capsular polysaccharide transport system permease protein
MAASQLLAGQMTPMAAIAKEGQLEEQIRVIDLDRPDADAPFALAPRPPVSQAARAARLAVRGAWWLLLLLPTVVAAVYALVMAADRYETETRLVIRNAAQLELGRPASGLLMGFPNLSHDEGHIARSFLLSRDALAFLEARLPIREMLTPPASDVLYAFPPPLFRASDEAFFRHYLRFVDAELDTGNGLLAVRVRAFSHSDAELIARTLVEATEDLVNRLNVRPSASALRMASAEVAHMQAQAVATQEALTQWRAENRLVDPARLAAVYVETIARLSLELAQVNAQLAEIEASSPRSPQLGPLLARAAALRAQVRTERETMASATSGLSVRISEYERLSLNREFAERSLQAALATLEAAKRDAERQRLFLEQVVQPRAPDWPRYPRPVLLVCTVLVFNILLVLIGRALLRDTRTHAVE